MNKFINISLMIIVLVFLFCSQPKKNNQALLWETYDSIFKKAN